LTATVTCRVFTGTGAATMSSGQTGITLTDVDALSGGDVIPGTVSYERWIALRVDAAPTVGVANFSVTNSGALPTGVVIKFGVTGTARTPINTASDIATMTLAAGRKYVFDANTYSDVGDLTRYLVLQEVVDNSASSGVIPQHTLQFGFQEA
jgi:hypothetical protein